jgi:hypothetical protein
MKTLPACLAVFACVTAALAAPAGGVDDAKAAFDSGDYRACLKKVSSALSSNSVRRDSPERYDLLMLRGESLLRLKQRAAAVTAFEGAAGIMKGRADVPRAAAATATAALVKASQDLAYQSRSPAGAAGIDVVEPASRVRAMQAFFADLDAELSPRIEAALRDSSLVPTDQLLRKAWELYAVDTAAHGRASSTEAKLQQLGEHARSLIAAELERIITRLDQLNDLAGEPTWVAAGMSYRGLRTAEREELRRAADNLVKIQRTVEGGRRISRALGRSGEQWDALLADCATARESAQEAYDRRY